MNVTERLDLREAWIITKVSIIPGFKSRFMRTTLHKLEFLLKSASICDDAAILHLSLGLGWCLGFAAVV